MTLFWWTVTLLIMLVGLVGSILPWIPGAVLIFAGAVLHYVMLGPEHSVGVTTLVILGVLMVVGQLIDLVSSSLGAKWFGASRWGALGGLVGTIVGLFFGLIGIFLGPILGVLVGELLAGRGILPAGRSTWGTFLGTTAGMIGKIAVAAVMVAWFLVAALA